MRERIAQHRANPTCASCHAMMDPVGLSLENFDFVGRWRTVDEALIPIDASVVLPDGTAFAGPAGLRNVLVSRSRSLRPDVHGETADVCARSRARALRHAGGANNHARRGPQQLPHVFNRAGRRQECSISDAEAAVMIITRMALPRRTILRGLGATIALPVLDAMVPAFVRPRRKRPPERNVAWGSSTFPTASR